MAIWKKFRINLFDVLIGILILSVIGAFFLLRMTKKTQWITVRLVIANNDWTYEGAPPQWWYADGLTVGQKTYDSFGNVAAEIINTEILDIEKYRRRIFVDIKLRGSFDAKRQVYLHNYQPVQIGKALDLTFGKQNARGIVTHINELPEYSTHIIDVRLPAVRPWVAESFRNGLQMKDSQGKALAEILTVSISPSQVRQVTEIDEFTEKIYDGSQFLNVILRLKILTFQSGGVDHFVDLAAIKVGEQISFQFPKTITREAEIIRIVE